MNKIGFLFPGQGSQRVGMGADLHAEYDAVREIFDAADEIAHTHITNLCFKGPMEELTATVNLQPAVTAVNLACLFAIEKEGIRCSYCAGHSLGEYSALKAAGTLSMPDTLKAVFRRGELMHRESVKFKGAMHAIVGLDINTVNEIVEKAQDKGIVSVANHNSESQIVITGEPDAVKTASIFAKERGARAIPLKVSGAWHSELIRGAEKEFSRYLEGVEFKSPGRPVIHNVTADTQASGDLIRELMVKQLCSPVKWYDTIVWMMKEKIDVFVEVGPGKVLTGLLKKILPSDYACRIFNVGDMRTLETFLKEVS